MTDQPAPQNAAEDPNARANSAGNVQKKPRRRPFQKGHSGRKRGKGRFSRDIKSQLAKDFPAIIDVLSEKARGGHVAAGIAFMRNAIPAGTWRADQLPCDAGAAGAKGRNVRGLGDRGGRRQG
jgi:hypothetical protein